MTNKAFNDSVTDSIQNLVALTNKAEPTSFSQWLEQNNDSIECCDNCTEIDGRIQQGERAFDGEDAEEWMRRSDEQGAE